MYQQSRLTIRVANYSRLNECMLCTCGILPVWTKTTRQVEITCKAECFRVMPLFAGGKNAALHQNDSQITQSICGSNWDDSRLGFCNMCVLGKSHFPCGNVRHVNSNRLSSGNGTVNQRPNARKVTSWLSMRVTFRLSLHQRRNRLQLVRIEWARPTGIVFLVDMGATPQSSLIKGKCRHCCY